MFPYKGFSGKWLFVDLTAGKIEVRENDTQLFEDYLGGNGFGTRLLWDNVPPEVEPLSPENWLIFATGCLTGTLIPDLSRMEIIAKSPLTGIYGDSNTGGFFGPELKFAGWDAIVFVGRASQPTYFWISDSHAELRDACDLWGLSTTQTESAIRNSCHDSQIKVAAIGPGGENMVRFAGIQCTPQRSAARAGMGAVMGSKNLKAVAVRGHGPVRIAEPQRFHDLAASFNRRLQDNTIYEAVHRFGTPGITSLMSVMGRFPTRNFQLGSFEHAGKIDAEALEERAFVRHLACFGCPIACDKQFIIPDGRFAGTALSSVEYENLNSLGAGVDNADIDTILSANRFCDEMGMDAISAGRAISFAMELWEKEIITLQDTGGLALNWGDTDVLMTLLEMIARREGFGNVLADGVRAAAKSIGKGAEEYAMHVKGMEIPGQDGRAQKSMGLAHATSNRGADHLKAFPTVDEIDNPEDVLSRYGEAYLPEMCKPLETKYKPMLVKDGEDFAAIVDSVGVCKSGGTFVMTELYWPDIAAAVEAATGMEMPVDRMKQIGERIYNLQRCYNARHGIGRKDDRLPSRFTETPSPSGNAKGSVTELDQMLAEYYVLRDWDSETGWPSTEKLSQLGLEDAVEELGLLQ